MRTQAFRVEALRGIDERWKAPEAAASKCRDLTRTQNDSWRDAGGIRQIISTSDFDGEGGIQSIHWFAQHNGARQWTIWETSQGALRYFNGSSANFWTDIRDVDGDAIDGTTRTRTVSVSPWQRTQSQTFGNRLYLTNGLDEPLVFSGRTVERAGFDQAAPAPIASVLDESENWTSTVFDEGLGRLTSDPAATEKVKCAYRYVVTFLNERGQESPPSSPSEMVLMNNGNGDPEAVTGGIGGRSFVQVEIPTGGSEVVARRVYRTRNILNSDGEPLNLGYSEVFYFLKEIQDNVVDSFEDFTPDTGLGSVLDPLDYGAWPTSVKYMAVFKNTMFISGMPDNTVRYSRPLFPEVFPEDNVIDIGDAALGPITGMYATKNALVVFKTRGIYLIKGDPSNGFFSETLTKDEGCIAPNSIAELPGLGLAFLGNTGIHLLAGALENTGTPTQVVNLSSNIPRIFNRLNKSAAINAFGVIYHRDKEYWLSIPTIGEKSNNLVLCYHYEVGEWSTRENIPAGCMVETADHRGYLLIGSNDPGNKAGVHVYSHGWPDRLNGDEIQPLYETTDIEFGSVYGTVQPATVMVHGIAYGNNDLGLNYTVNSALDGVRASSQTVDQQDPNDRLEVYGTAVWGSSRWAKLRPFVARFDISTTTSNPCRELSLSIEPSLRRVELIGYDVEVKVGEQRLIKPLNEALNPGGG